MFILKTIYLAFQSVLILLCVWCLIRSLKKNTPVYKSASWIIISFLGASISIGATYIVQNEMIAEILVGLYLAFHEFSLYLVLRLIYAIEGRKVENIKNRFSVVLYIICILTALLVICNFAVRKVSDSFTFYTIIPDFSNGKFLGWRIDFPSTIVIYLVVCYVIGVHNVVRFIIDIVKSNRINRLKFLFFMIIYLLEEICNTCFLRFSKDMRFDYSMTLYGIIIIAFYLFMSYSIPRKIRRSILTRSTEELSDAVCCFDYYNKCVYANKNARKIYNKDNDEWVNYYFDQLEDSLIKTEVFSVDNEMHFYETEFRRIRDEKGHVVGSYLKMNDRTEDVQMLENQHFIATHDKLTGVYNRNFFFREAERIIRNDPDVPRYMVCTNIKNFKLINDLFGTKFGDNVLRTQADKLSLAKYKNCIIGRISGDKFAMLISKEDFKPELAIKNSDIVSDIIRNRNIQFRILIGVYEIPDPFENVHSMYDKANMALRSNSDVNKVLSMYDNSLMQKLINEKNIVSEFKYAIEGDGICMFLQPQIDSSTGKCVGAEALARWYDEKTGYKSPSEFIGILEKSGLIYQLDRYIWEKACQKLREWKDSGFENYHISVNISVKDFYYEDLYEVFTGLVEKYGISVKNLKLEITESMIMNSNTSHKKIINKLQSYGFVIEMDDFGSGYSSLNSLKELKMDVLKIDMEFLRATENEERGTSIITCIVEMAKKLGMQVVCEGVENEKHVTFLKDVGVDLFQGFYYSRPIAVYDFEHKYLEAKK